MPNETAAAFSAAHLSRRRMIQASGALLLTLVIDGKTVRLSAEEAKRRGLSIEPLTADEAALVERLGNILVVRGGDYGLAHFLAHQLAKDYGESLLMLRYLDVSPPYLNFYREGLRALDASAGQRHGAGFVALDQAQAQALVRDMSAGRLEEWSGAIPASLFYFVIRADAIDVAYGTYEGLARLGVPHMAHIEPDEVW